MTTASAPALTELTGSYTLDPAHTRIGFVARHAMVTKVRGAFNEFTGTAVLDGANPENSTVQVTIQAASIDTRNAQRDDPVHERCAERGQGNGATLAQAQYHRRGREVAAQVELARGRRRRAGEPNPERTA